MPTCAQLTKQLSAGARGKVATEWKAGGGGADAASARRSYWPLPFLIAIGPRTRCKAQSGPHSRHSRSAMCHLSPPRSPYLSLAQRSITALGSQNLGWRPGAANGLAAKRQLAAQPGLRKARKVEHGGRWGSPGSSSSSSILTESAGPGPRLGLGLGVGLGLGAGVAGIFSSKKLSCEEDVSQNLPAAASETAQEVDKVPIRDYEIIRMPGDGRCLFHAVAHGACRSSGQRLEPGEQRQLADELRSKAVDELVKRREETEWFIEGDFDHYVTKMRRPSAWGGEPEVLMLSHVLRTPITVYIAHPSGNASLISIAEYGQEHDPKRERAGIHVLYNGSSHYDALALPAQQPVDARARL